MYTYERINTGNWSENDFLNYIVCDIKPVENKNINLLQKRENSINSNLSDRINAIHESTFSCQEDVLEDGSLLNHSITIINENQKKLLNKLNIEEAKKRRNRESAKRLREKKKVEFEQTKKKVEDLTKILSDIESKISLLGFPQNNEINNIHLKLNCSNSSNNSCENLSSKMLQNEKKENTVSFLTKEEKKLRRRRQNKEDVKRFRMKKKAELEEMETKIKTLKQKIDSATVNLEYALRQSQIETNKKRKIAKAEESELYRRPQKLQKTQSDSADNSFQMYSLERF
jgi:hypothetical protein